MARHLERHLVAIAALVMLLHGAGEVLFGEKWAVNDGLGYDGVSYATYAVSLQPEAVTAEGRGLRVVPSLLVHAAVRLLRAPPTLANVRRGFEWLNVVALVAGVLVFGRIARALALPPPHTALALTALFVNHAFLKHVHYTPVMTDATALLLGLLCLWAWVARSTIGLFVASLASAFTWPDAVPCAVLLLAYPFRETPLEDRPSSRSAPLAYALLWLPGFVYYNFVHVFPPGTSPMGNTIAPLLPLSIAIALGYLYLGARSLTATSLAPGRLVTPRLLFGIALVALTWAIQHAAGLGSSSGPTSRLGRIIPYGSLVSLLFWRPVAKPAIFSSVISFFSDQRWCW